MGADYGSLQRVEPRRKARQLRPEARSFTYADGRRGENTEYCFRLATNCRRDGNVTGAIFWLRKCVSISPEVAKYHASLVTSLATLGHFRREAVEHFQKAIELGQWNPLAYLQLGELYEAMQLPWRAGPLHSKVWRWIRGTAWRVSDWR